MSVIGSKLPKVGQDLELIRGLVQPAREAQLLPPHRTPVFMFIWTAGSSLPSKDTIPSLVGPDCWKVLGEISFSGIFHSLAPELVTDLVTGQFLNWLQMRGHHCAQALGWVSIVHE